MPNELTQALDERPRPFQPGMAGVSPHDIAAAINQQK
jgi:hypothetical protein